MHWARDPSVIRCAAQLSSGVRCLKPATQVDAKCRTHSRTPRVVRVEKRPKLPPVAVRDVLHLTVAQMIALRIVAIECSALVPLRQRDDDTDDSDD